MNNMVVEALRYMLAEVEEKLTSVEEENARLKEENERLYLLYQEHDIRYYHNQSD